MRKSAAEQTLNGPGTLRIGEVAARVGTTPRTIRYYEEIGLLPTGEHRPGGGHRSYTEADVERLAEILRLKDLLGLSLEAVRGILEAHDARRGLRARYQRTDDPAEQRRLLADALVHIERQLTLVRERRAELGRFERELCAKQQRVRELLETSGG